MRITKGQLKRIIREEYRRILNEAVDDRLYTVNFTKDGVEDKYSEAGKYGQFLFKVLASQQPYYKEIVNAKYGVSNGMKALKRQIAEKDGNENISDSDIQFSNEPMAESVSRYQLRNIIRQEYGNIVRENRRRRRY